MRDLTSQPTADDGSRRRRRLFWALIVAFACLLGALIVLLLGALLWAPDQLYPNLTDAETGGITDAEKLLALNRDRSTLQNTVRASLIQGFTGLLVLIGGVITAGAALSASLRQVRATRDQIRETALAAQKQLELSEQGQLTDRYTKAVDQLGSNELEVRMGGIFALERITRQSPDDRVTIYAVISAFVRGRSPWPPRLPGQYWADVPVQRMPELLARAADVQAALTVLAHRTPVEAEGRWPGQEAASALDLSHTDLRRADLAQARLDGAWLHGARLAQAILLGAHLREAQLIRADLEEAALGGARLRGADLTAANLVGADLRDADLSDADLSDADLSDADLSDADLSDAELAGAKANSRTRWPHDWSRERALAAGVSFVNHGGSP